MRRLLICGLLVLVCAAAGAQNTTPGYTFLHDPNTVDQNFVLAGNGSIYGANSYPYGNADGLFSVTKSGAEITYPSAPGYLALCLQASDSTMLGYANVNSQTNFYKITLAGASQLLAAAPAGISTCPVMANDGNYYGLVANGGAYSKGEIYELTPAGTVTNLYSFTGASDGSSPIGLVQASDGNFYGLDSTAQYAYGLFRFNASSGLTNTPLNTQVGLDIAPAPLIEASDGNFYTYNPETLGGEYPQPSIYQIKTNGDITPLPVANSYSESGSHQILQLFLGGDGQLYISDSFPASFSGCGIEYNVAMFPMTLSGTESDSYFFLLGGPYSDNSAYAVMQLEGDGNFYGSNYITANTFDDDCDPISSTTTYAIFSEVSSTPPTPPIQMTLSADHILPGKTSTLTWKVNNAFSDTMQQCYGYGGLSGKLALTGSVVSPGAGAGIYSSGIVCGGTEANNVILTVGNTQVSLTSNRTEIVAGQTVTLTASVANDANPSPTGTVQFLYGATVLGTGKVNSAGTAAFTASTSGIPPGTYAITAKYLGDGNYSAAKSAAVSIKVVSRGTTNTVLSPATQKVIIGQNVPITATITTNSVLANPSGTVSLLVGTTVVATADVVYGNPSTAMFSANSAGLAPGTYTVTAKYSGDTYNLPSTSGPVTVKLIKQDTLTVTASPNPVPANTAFQLTATATGGVTPTGTVLFYAGALGLGSATLNGSGVGDINVSAGTLGAGSYQVTAHYAGDANNAAITSPAITLTVQ